MDQLKTIATFVQIAKSRTCCDDQLRSPPIPLKNSLLAAASKRDSICNAAVTGVGDDGRAVWIAGAVLLPF
jgi:hypothetical protein